jgi:glutamate/tyrosine decarboxylase-like PLP-dependent enzyme
MAPDVAYQLIHDELMLDGNARLNLATFVGTWMEPQRGPQPNSFITDDPPLRPVG